VLGDSLISDVDRAVITVHGQLGRKFHLVGDRLTSRPCTALDADGDHRARRVRPHIALAAHAMARIRAGAAGPDQGR